MQIVDKFRRYDNATQSFQDFVDFLRQNPRYDQVMNLVDQGKANVTSATGKLKGAKGALKFTGFYDRDKGGFNQELKSLQEHIVEAMDELPGQRS